MKTTTVNAGTKPRARKRKADAPGVEIRPMRLEDLPEVYALGQRLFTAEKLPTLYRSWDEDEVMKLFSAEQETCLVAIAQGRVVGFALGSLMQKRGSAWRYGWLEWLGVDPAWSRRGVASRLVRQLTSLFIERDARIMLVDTDEANEAALAFFRKLGFGQELRHIYLSQNLDSHPEAIERRERERDAADEEE
ncbi:MAG: GNAT family N-acetyltransferase [Verrucomicrobiota bacterium]|nr:GNAT family N-acetyltransferase [Limisphaera sp.]MDW8382597.1 GNAT family N-acetyltransferase [Verrucomicrobiota bacterium]